MLDIYLDTSQLFDKIGWGEFFRSFSGHNMEVTRRFSLSLRENVAQIGNVRLDISESFIAKAKKLLQKGERWFNKKEINREKWKHFLLPLPEGFDDKHGYPIKYLKPQWELLLQMIIRYIVLDVLGWTNMVFADRWRVRLLDAFWFIEVARTYRSHLDDQFTSIDGHVWQVPCLIGY